jgi:F-type H+-transporting ATPase subunit gamma
MKITRAMELIATSRIAKAQQRVVQSQPYTQKMTDVIRNIAAASGGLSHPLFESREVTTAGVVIVTSDRGLAGGYNANVMRLAERGLLEHRHQGRQTRVYVVGKKAQGYFSYRKYRPEQSFLGVTDRPTYGDARAIANILLNEYEDGRVDSVDLYTTRYVSALTQTPVLWPLLPIQPPVEIETDATPIGYTFEPSPEQILNRLLPRYLEGTVFGVLLEASASEHAARRRAMKAATENAEELVRLLTREANQARQAEITTEISEIVGGAEALSAS